MWIKIFTLKETFLGKKFVLNIISLVDEFVSIKCVKIC